MRTNSSITIVIILVHICLWYCPQSADHASEEFSSKQRSVVSRFREGRRLVDKNSTKIDGLEFAMRSKGSAQMLRLTGQTQPFPKSMQRQRNNITESTKHFNNNQTNNYKYKICIVARVKNAAYLVPQWIEYHLLAGIGHFYVADDCSNDGGKTSFWLNFYQSLGYVSYYPNQTFNNCTHQHMIGIPMGTHLLLDFLFPVAKTSCEWLTVYDPDEYIIPTGRKKTSQNDREFAMLRSSYAGISLSVLKLLEAHKRPVIRMPWYVASTHGFEHRPPGLVIDSYLDAKFHPPGRPIIKTLIRTKYVKKWNFSHYPTIFEDFAPNVSDRPLWKHASRSQLASSETASNEVFYDLSCPMPKSPVILKHFMVLAWDDYILERGARSRDADGNVNPWAKNPRQSWQEWNFTLGDGCPRFGEEFLISMSIAMRRAARKRLQLYRSSVSASVPSHFSYTDYFLSIFLGESYAAETQEMLHKRDFSKWLNGDILDVS